MKRYNHIFERIINIDNIIKAINRASKGKRGRKEVERMVLCQIVLVDNKFDE